MKFKEYEMPDGRKAVFEYDENGVGKITLECMDMLMMLINDRKTEPTISKMEQVEDDAYFLELMGAVERGEISDAGANQAWYEYINHKDEPQIEPLPKIINGVRIADAVAWADKWLEDNSVSEMWDMIRTLRDATEWQDEPQTDCHWR